MKIKYFIIVLVAVILISTILITRTKSVNSTGIYPVAMNPSIEIINNNVSIEGLEEALRINPRHTDAKVKLVYAYIQQGRVSGNHEYYDALAFKRVNEILEENPENFEALSARALLQASAHQFNDALETAKKAIKINPHNSYIYGILCDAYVELGKYEDAIKTADKMVSLRPDVSSYSRISYLREITGDYQGAIEAMNRAVVSGLPGLEQTEWSRVYLGKLYEITGKLKDAELNYNIALANRNNFPAALAGLARVAKAKKDYSGSINFYKEAIRYMEDYSFHHELALLYQLTNQDQKAEQEFQIAIDLLTKHQHPTTEENGIGHNIDLELALVYNSMNKYEAALNSAKFEYERRPDNIDVNSVLAWAYYNVESYKEAHHHILKALKTKSKNAELWYKAGLIFKSNKYETLGDQYIEIALRTNPKLDTTLLITGIKSSNLALQ